jgi:sugar lactone lactonase YvrE
MTPVRQVVDCETILGEGPVWDAAAGRLWWVDIKGGALHWLDPASGDHGKVAVAGQVSAVAPRAGGEGLVAARQDGVGILDPVTGAFTHRFDPEPDRPGNRANDGNVDLAGRFWFGTMDDGEQARTGAVYRLGPDWTCRRVLDGLGISNTLVCTHLGDGLFVADSQAQTIDLLEIDPATGETGARRAFAHTRGEAFSPDGSAVDAEGYLWNAQWGAARLVRYAPDGRIDRIVPVPADHPSSCAFGGENLATLYITTARWLMRPEALASQPWAGSLLAFEPGVPGLPLPPFGG